MVSLWDSLTNGDKISQHSMGMQLQRKITSKLKLSPTKFPTPQTSCRYEQGICQSEHPYLGHDGWTPCSRRRASLPGWWLHLARMSSPAARPGDSSARRSESSPGPALPWQRSLASDRLAATGSGRQRMDRSQLGESTGRFFFIYTDPRYVAQ